MTVSRDILSEYLAFPFEDDSPDMLKARVRVLSALCAYLSVNVSEHDRELERMMRKHLDNLFYQTLQSFHAQKEMQEKSVLMSILFELAFHTGTFPDFEKENICLEAAEDFFEKVFSSPCTDEFHTYPADMTACAAHYLTWAGTGNAAVVRFYESELSRWRSLLSVQSLWADISDSEAWKRIAVLAADDNLPFLEWPQPLLEKIVRTYRNRLPRSIAFRKDLDTLVSFTDAVRFFPSFAKNPDDILFFDLLWGAPVQADYWQTKSCLTVHSIQNIFDKTQKVLFR